MAERAETQKRSIFFGNGFNYRFLIILLFVAISVSGISFSLYLFLISNNMYTFVIAAVFFILSLVASVFNIYAAYLYYRSYFYNDYLNRISRGLKPINRYPKVAVIVPIRNENPDIVKRTLSSLMLMNYPKDKIRIYVSDSSSDMDAVDKIRDFCKSNGLTYIYGENRKGKAGNLNRAMEALKDERYVAIFDYDERLVDRNFLIDLIPYFDDKMVAYVQTEKAYDKGNLFTESIDLFDKFFFKFIEPARAMNNTAIYAGSCGLISRSVLNEMGGFPEYVIEDTFFSFDAHSKGYKGLYIPKVYALGIQLKTFSALSKQQWRYNFGDTEFIGYFVAKRKYMKERNMLDHMDYIMHGLGLSYISVILICFTVVSILIVFSTLSYTHISLGYLLNLNNITLDLEILGSGALFLSVFAPVVLSKIYFGSFKKGFMLFALNYALAITRAKAVIAVILRKNPFTYWRREARVRKNDAYFSLISTKVELLFAGLIFAFSYIAISTDNLIGGAWLIWYGIMYIFATIFVYRYG
ncbi:MAG: glycosyltransferase [Candidatus Marsarchaeota archaeon]|nr:glycosyltransferase [Candidatus Marsarchaeota archaeon]